MDLNEKSVLKQTNIASLHIWTMGVLENLKLDEYRTRANKRCSRLVAAPLINYPENDFLCVFYMIIRVLKKYFQLQIQTPELLAC